LAPIGKNFLSIRFAKILLFGPRCNLRERHHRSQRSAAFPWHAARQRGIRFAVWQNRVWGLRAFPSWILQIVGCL